MLHQFAGLAIYTLGYAERYDLYFNFEKILYEGQVCKYRIYSVNSIIRSGASSPAFSLSKDSISTPSSKLCFCKPLDYLAITSLKI